MIHGIDLKIANYKEFAGHDGMPGFNVDIVYNGKRVAHGYDDAWGGGIQYNDIVDQKAFDELNARIKALPKLEGQFGGMEQQLEFLIDDLSNELRMKKDEKKGILCKTLNGWQTFGWNIQLPAVIKREGSAGLKDIQDYYNELKAEGKEILNGEYLASIGVVL